MMRKQSDLQEPKEVSLFVRVLCSVVLLLIFWLTWHFTHSPFIVAQTILSAVCSGLFVRWQKRNQHKE